MQRKLAEKSGGEVFRDSIAAGTNCQRAVNARRQAAATLSRQQTAPKQRH
jgi:hypothetical protein